MGKYAKVQETPIKTTSGFNFEGYQITEYLDVICGEAAMGSGYFKQLFAGMSGVFGVESESFNKKMEEARYIATTKIKGAARDLGANAIIGFTYDYETVGGALFCVIASGTAVTIEKTVEEKLPEQSGAKS